MSEYTLEERSRKYDELYLKASKIMAKFNPCKIENGTCIQGRKSGCNFCCEGCLHLSSTGCAAQSLWCKTWVCEAAASAMPLEKYFLFDDLMSQIDKEARKYNFFRFRAGKSTSLEMGNTV
jgi:hypothetical protein